MLFKKHSLWPSYLCQSPENFRHLQDLPPLFLESNEICHCGLLCSCIPCFPTTRNIRNPMDKSYIGIPSFPCVMICQGIEFYIWPLNKCPLFLFLSRLSSNTFRSWEYPNSCFPVDLIWRSACLLQELKAMSKLYQVTVKALCIYL